MSRPDRIILRTGSQSSEGWSALLRVVQIEQALRSQLPEVAVTVVASGGPVVWDFLYGRVRDLVELQPDTDAEREALVLRLRSPVAFTWVDGTGQDLACARAWTAFSRRVGCRNPMPIAADGRPSGSLLLSAAGGIEILPGAAHGLLPCAQRPVAAVPRVPCGGGTLHLRLHRWQGADVLELVQALRAERAPWASVSVTNRPDHSIGVRKALQHLDLDLISIGAESRDAAADLWVVDTISSALEARALGIPFLFLANRGEEDGRLAVFCRLLGGWFLGSVEPQALVAILRVRARDAASLYERARGAQGVADHRSWFRVLEAGAPELIACSRRLNDELHNRKDFPLVPEGRRTIHIQG